MANELHIGYGGALTVYAIIRRISDATVWDADAATWDTWADADIGDYDIPLADKGGGLYAATMPSAITDTTQIWVTYYEQQGASPALDDLALRRDTDTASNLTLDSINARLTTLIGAGTVANTTVTVQKTDIEYFRGDTQTISFDSSVDLTGYTALKFTAKARLTDDQDDAQMAYTEADGEIVVTDAAAGQFTVAPAAADTSELCPNGIDWRGHYDVELTDASGKIATLFAGRFTVGCDVTEAS